VEVVVNGINRGLMGPEGQVADQVWEKVDDPASLTPQPETTETVAPVGVLEEAQPTVEPQ
jgi:hypothetical protein